MITNLKRIYKWKIIYIYIYIYIYIRYSIQIISMKFPKLYIVILDNNMIKYIIEHIQFEPILYIHNWLIINMMYIKY